MIKKICIILLLLNITCLLNSCWGSKQLSQLSIVTALGIDKNEDKFVVTAQIINALENSKYAGGGAPVSTFTSEGDTILEAVTKLSIRLPQKTYLSHLRLLVFGEKFGHSGIKESLDFFERHPEPRSDFFVVLSKDSTAHDFLKVLTSIEKIPANKIYNSLYNAQKFWSAAHAVTLFDLSQDFQYPMRNSVMNTVIIEGNPQHGASINNIRTSDPETRLKLGYLAVIKNEKVIDFLTERESAAYNAVNGTIHNSVMSLKISEGLLNYEVKFVHAKIIPYIENNQLKIKIKIDETGNISEVNSNINLTDPDNIKKIEKVIANDSESKLKELFQKAQDELQCDFIGIYNTIHRSYPKIYRDHVDEWDSFFANIPVEYDVTSRINTFGIIKNATY